MGRAKKNVEVEAQVIARGNVVPMMTETESAETVQYVSDEDELRHILLEGNDQILDVHTCSNAVLTSCIIPRWHHLYVNHGLTEPNKMLNWNRR